MFMRRQDRVADYALLPRTAESRQVSAVDEDYRRLKRRRTLLQCHTPCIEHGVLSAVLCAGRDRVVNLQWWEKFWLLVDNLQIFAALWVAECAAATKRFPQSWCTGGTQRILYANLDVHAWDAYAAKALNSTEQQLSQAAATREWQDANSWWLILAPPAVLLLLTVELLLLRESVLLALGGGAGKGGWRGTARYAD